MSIDLFGPRPRRAPRVMMHVNDAYGGDGDDAAVAVFRCARCGHETEWTGVRTITEGRRGKPCPKCNPSTEAAS